VKLAESEVCAFLQCTVRAKRHFFGAEVDKREFIKVGFTGLGLFAPWVLAKADVTEPVLWRVEGPTGAVNWVLATVETPPGFVAPFKSEVEPALHASQIIGTQYFGDINSVLERAKLLLSPSATLVKTIGQSTYENLLPLLLQRGYPEHAVSRLCPWAAALLLLTPASDPGELAMDTSLIQYSLETQKQYFGVLTIGQQVSPFQTLPLPQQVALLSALVYSSARLDAIFVKNIRAYLQGDMSQVKVMDAIQELLPLKENKLWFLAWQKRLKQTRVHDIAAVLRAPFLQGGVLVGLDCELLQGSSGVLARLAHAGFGVSPSHGHSL
jgi:uncharacterized protein YbaP (TraB family)